MTSNRRLHIAVPSLMAGLFISSVGLVAASSANISHSYSGAGNIATGSLVSLDSSQDNYVLPANLDTANRLVGIVVAENDSLVAIDSAGDKLQIATSGIANALVSDVNGSVKTGDHIAVSPFSGVGMKAQPGSRIIGLAQTTLGENTTKLVTRQITDKDGKKQPIQVGFVRVSIAIGSVPAAVTDADKNVLQRLAISVTGKPVSTARLVISSAIAIIAILALVTLIYTSVYGTIVAVGRNPLAKASIFRALWSVAGLVLVTSVVALGTIYLIIR